MSSPEDLLTACATSQEERQRLISWANEALSLWDNWLHPFVAMLTRYGQACHPRRPAARKAALEWLNSVKVIDTLLLWPEVDSNDAGLTVGAINLLESAVKSGRDLLARQSYFPAG